MSKHHSVARLLRALRPIAASAFPKNMSTLPKNPRPRTDAIDEETSPGYDPTDFYPMRPGQVLNNAYRIITKLGWGASSSVWLGEDLRRAARLPGFDGDKYPRYIALKIGTIHQNVENELNVSQRIAATNPSHPGASFLRTPIHDFSLQGPHGTHVCLVYHPMRETLYELISRFRGNKLPPQLLKLYLNLLLQALDYLHRECLLIHTDLKPENILVRCENDTVLEDFVQHHQQHPPPEHTREDGHVVYASQSDFGPLRESLLLPVISDFDQAVPAGLHPQPIQSHCYRAPEVIFGAGWTHNADIWNLGAMIWTLMEDDELFTSLEGEDGEYSAHVHLAQMVALLGPPPDLLIQRAKYAHGKNWEPRFENARGETFANASEFFGGPFFNDAGELIRQDLIPSGWTLADRVTLYEGEEKALFLDFVGKMLRWYPKDRLNADALLNHPFLVMEDEFYESYDILPRRGPGGGGNIERISEGPSPA